MTSPSHMVDTLTRFLEGERSARVDLAETDHPDLADAVNRLLDRHAEAAYKRDLYFGALSDMVGRFEETVGYLSAVKRMTGLLADGGVVRVEDVCRAATRVLVEEVGVDNCSILLQHPREDVLALVAAYGQTTWWGDNGEEPPAYNRFLRFKRGEGIAGRVAETLEPYLCEDVTQDDLYLELAECIPLKSIFAIPLAHDGHLLGVLNVSDQAANPFSAHRRRGLILVAEVVGQVLVLCRKCQTLAESEAFHRDLVENAAEVMISTDLGLCLNYLNGAGRAFFGLEPPDVQGFHFLQRVHPEDVDRVRACVHDLMYGKPLGRVPIHFALGEDAPQVLHCSFRLIDEEGWPLGIEIIGRAQEGAAVREPAPSLSV